MAAVCRRTCGVIRLFLSEDSSERWMINVCAAGTRHRRGYPTKEEITSELCRVVYGCLVENQREKDEYQIPTRHNSVLGIMRVGGDYIRKYRITTCFVWNIIKAEVSH